MNTIHILRDVNGNELGRSTGPIVPMRGTYGFMSHDKTWVGLAEGAYVDVVDDVAGARAQVWERIKARRDAIQDGGVQVGGKWFHTDTKSRVQQLALLSLGQGLPQGIQWKTMDNTFVELTPTLVQQLFGASIAREQAVFTRAEVLRAAAEASDNPDAIDIGSGWPASFGA